MDPIENKINKFYKEKKREDEKSMPGFNVFVKKPDQTEVKKRSYLLLRVAASVAIFVFIAGLLYYFNNSDHPARQSMEIYPINLNQPLPSQSLLDQNPGMQYLWEWKAPTDKLLEDAKESINKGTLRKI